MSVCDRYEMQSYEFWASSWVGIKINSGNFMNSCDCDLASSNLKRCVALRCVGIGGSTPDQQVCRQLHEYASTFLNILHQKLIRTQYLTLRIEAALPPPAVFCSFSNQILIVPLSLSFFLFFPLGHLFRLSGVRLADGHGRWASDAGRVGDVDGELEDQHDWVFAAAAVQKASFDFSDLCKKQGYKFVCAD